MSYTQDNRMLAIATPLGKDALLLESFQGTEGISRLFNFELTMLSEKPGILFDDIVGKSVTISVVLSSGARRFFNGIVSRFVQGAGGGATGIDPRFSSYRATVIPWLWLLTRTADSRIFQKMSVPEIVEKIFHDQGFADFTLKLQGSYAKRDYCVQYRETDFNFVSRLLEEEGIYYYFEHTDNKHTLILANSPPSDNDLCPHQKTARFQMNIGGKHDDDVIYSLEKMQEIRPAKYTLNDFNFVTPNTGLKAESPTKYKLGPGEREIYDYPGLYGTKAEGDRYAGLRMEEEESQITTIVGGSECRAFMSGYSFTLEGYYRKEMNGKKYLLTSVQHQCHQGWGNDATPEYSNRFTCTPAEIPYRPVRLTPKPLVQGLQTAIVVGPPGDEIYTDEHGRVKVQFHWDREGKKNEESSCWMRVSQLWAGAGWGAMFIPRIGQEVIVDFLEGDPDRPIITGRVYHGINKPPYPLPAEKTKSTIKSNSSKGGGGFNEFRFEDKKGHEEIFLHGEKDWNIVIKHDKDQDVGHNEHLHVHKNRTKKVGVNQSENVGENKTINVGMNHSETIGMSMSLSVGTNSTETVAINKAETIGAAKELTIGGAYQLSVGGVMNETVGGAKAEEVGGYRAEVVGGYNQVTVGGYQKISVGADLTEEVSGKASHKVSDNYSLEAKEVAITASSKLTLSCSGNTITMDPSGITINGMLVTITGTLVKINS